MADAANRPSYQKVDGKVEVMDTPYDRWVTSQGIDISTHPAGNISFDFIPKDIPVTV